MINKEDIGKFRVVLYGKDKFDPLDLGEVLEGRLYESFSMGDLEDIRYYLNYHRNSYQTLTSFVGDGEDYELDIKRDLGYLFTKLTSDIYKDFYVHYLKVKVGSIANKVKRYGNKGKRVVIAEGYHGLSANIYQELRILCGEEDAKRIKREYESTYFRTLEYENEIQINKLWKMYHEQKKGINHLTDKFLNK